MAAPLLPCRDVGPPADGGRAVLMATAVRDGIRTSRVVRLDGSTFTVAVPGPAGGRGPAPWIRGEGPGREPDDRGVALLASLVRPTRKGPVPGPPG